MKIANHRVSVLLWVILIAGLIGCASTSTQESTGQYIDDSVITTKVKAKIAEDDVLKSFSISVQTFKGVVQLSGFVNSQITVDKAGRIASSVEGVKSVKNDLVVK
jgi:osmotically-inducible protein OsmY